MEPIAYNLLLGSDSFIAGSNFGLEQDFGFCLSSQDFQRNKSKSVRSRLSSFADWNRGPSLQTLLQQFGTQANNSQATATNDSTFNHYQAFFNSSNQTNQDACPMAAATAATAAVATANFNQLSTSSLSGKQHENLVLSRQCFLFNDYLLLCVRTKDGKLQLLEVSVCFYNSMNSFNSIAKANSKQMNKFPHAVP